MESIDDCATDWWAENYDDTSVNPNIIRPQDAEGLEVYMAALPFSLRSVGELVQAIEITNI